MRMAPAGLQRMRSRLALRQRFRNPVTVKNDAQRRWWLEQWDPVLRPGGLNPNDAASFTPAPHMPAPNPQHRQPFGSPRRDHLGTTSLSDPRESTSATSSKCVTAVRSTRRRMLGRDA
jgi:hypothetical protein